MGIHVVIRASSFLCLMGSTYITITFFDLVQARAALTSLTEERNAAVQLTQRLQQEMVRAVQTTGASHLVLDAYSHPSNLVCAGGVCTPGESGCE